MTKTQSKGKKKKGSSTWSLQKIGIIVIGVGFAVIMVVSSLGTGWLVSLNPHRSAIMRRYPSLSTMEWAAPS